jgi:uncharacterized membrane protein YdbT with pleckstrin-like domain
LYATIEALMIWTLLDAEVSTATISCIIIQISLVSIVNFGGGNLIIMAIKILWKYVGIQRQKKFNGLHINQ